MTITVHAIWDDDAGVWSASTTDIDGLAAEAATLDELRPKVLAMLADLIELNGSPSTDPEIAVHFETLKQAGLAKHF